MVISNSGSKKITVFIKMSHKTCFPRKNSKCTKNPCFFLHFRSWGTLNFMRKEYGNVNSHCYLFYQHHNVCIKADLDFRGEIWPPVTFCTFQQNWNSTELFGTSRCIKTNRASKLCLHWSSLMNNPMSCVSYLFLSQTS